MSKPEVFVGTDAFGQPIVAPEIVKSAIYIEDIKVPDHGNFWGYVIETTRQTIRIAISSEGRCCESFGCLFKRGASDMADRKRLDPADEVKILSEMVGKTVRFVGWGASKSLDDGYYYKNSQEIIIETVDGSVYQCLLWNDHNGYYSHSILLEHNAKRDIQQL